MHLNLLYNEESRKKHVPYALQAKKSREAALFFLSCCIRDRPCASKDGVVRFDMAETL